MAPERLTGVDVPFIIARCEGRPDFDVAIGDIGFCETFGEAILGADVDEVKTLAYLEMAAAAACAVEEEVAAEDEEAS